MIRSNIEMRVPKDWLDGPSEKTKSHQPTSSPLSGWPAHWTMTAQRTD
jgi:hypothetical protein